MWQNIIVYTILASVAAFTLCSFYRKFTGKSTCCGGGCTCKGGCGSANSTPGSCKDRDHACRCAANG